jgi:hypothetical protein
MMSMGLGHDARDKICRPFQFRIIDHSYPYGSGTGVVDPAGVLLVVLDDIGRIEGERTRCIRSASAMISTARDGGAGGHPEMGKQNGLDIFLLVLFIEGFRNGFQFQNFYLPPVVDDPLAGSIMGELQMTISCS